MARRKYGSSEFTPDKYDLFYKWFLKAYSILGSKFPHTPLCHIDLTAGPGIDTKGDPNVLFRAIEATQKAEVFFRTCFIAFEEDPERAELLRFHLNYEGLLSQSIETGKVFVIEGIFGEYSDWLNKNFANARGEICFDPAPDGESILDARLISKILPGNMSVSSYVGQTIMARVCGMLDTKEAGYTDRNGLGLKDWTYENLLAELRGSRRKGFCSKKMGSAGGRVVVFTNASTPPPGGMVDLDEGIQCELFKPAELVQGDLFA